MPGAQVQILEPKLHQECILSKLTPHQDAPKSKPRRHKLPFSDSRSLCSSPHLALYSHRRSREAPIPPTPAAVPCWDPPSSTLGIRQSNSQRRGRYAGGARSGTVHAGPRIVHHAVHLSLPQPQDFFECATLRPDHPDQNRTADLALYTYPIHTHCSYFRGVI